MANISNMVSDDLIDIGVLLTPTPEKEAGNSIPNGGIMAWL